jgi:hypothetical protein
MKCNPCCYLQNRKEQERLVYVSESDDEDERGGNEIFVPITTKTFKDLSSILLTVQIPTECSRWREETDTHLCLIRIQGKYNSVIGPTTDQVFDQCEEGRNSIVSQDLLCVLSPLKI